MVKRLRLINYRSYGHHQFELDPAITLVVGPNATGKTNLLEALYVVARTKSYRASDSELIKHGSDHFRLEAATTDAVIGLGYQTAPKVSKQLDYDKVKRPLTKHHGRMPVVLFEPSELDLLTGPPSGRRRYLDGIIGQINPSYQKAWAEYQRILKQRNALLERFDMGRVKEQIFAWDLNLTKQAALIADERLKYLDHLNDQIPQLYTDAAGSSLDVKFSYLPSVASADYAEAFLDTLVQNLPRDLAAGFTTIGPHREDFRPMIGHNEIGAVASRGEIRSLVLALKLLELSDLNQRGSTPLLLLDDVLSELDESRRNFLVEQIAGYQTIITATDAESLPQTLAGSTTILTSEVKNYATN